MRQGLQQEPTRVKILPKPFAKLQPRANPPIGLAGKPSIGLAVKPQVKQEIGLAVKPQVKQEISRPVKQESVFPVKPEIALPVQNEQQPRVTIAAPKVKDIQLSVAGNTPLSEGYSLESIINRPIRPDELIAPGFRLMADMANLEKHKQSDSARTSTRKPDINLQRVPPNEDPECMMITRQYDDDHWPPENERDILKWPIPDETGKVTFSLCFFVREVQQFIADNDKIIDKTETEPEKHECPMFEHEVIQKIFNTRGLKAYHVPPIMDSEFSSVFLEYDLLPQKMEIKSDAVTTIIIQQLEQYIATTVEETKDKPPAEDKKADPEKYKLMRVAGFFWYATKQSLKFLVGTVVPGLAKFALWMLRNPLYTRIIFIVVRVIRIVLCIKSSFTTITDQALDALFNALRQYAYGYGQVILDGAKSLVRCFTGVVKVMNQEVLEATSDLAACSAGPLKVVWDSFKYYAPQNLKNVVSFQTSMASNSLYNIGQFFGSHLNMIAEKCGVSMFSNVFRVMSGDEASKSDVLGLGAAATTAENLRLAFTTWSPDLLSFNVVIFVLNIAMTVIDIFQMPTKSAAAWVSSFVLPIPLIGPLMAKIVTAGVGGIPNVVRLLLVMMRRFEEVKSLRTIVVNAFYEIYEWLTDLVPCLMKFMSEKLMTWISFGTITNVIVSPGDELSLTLKPTCCMTPLIREIQRHFVFGELDRKLNVEAQDLKKKRSEIGYMDYFFTGEATQQLMRDEQKLRHDRDELARKQGTQGGAIQTTYTTRSWGDRIKDAWYGSELPPIPQPIVAAASVPGGKAFFLNKSVNKVRTRRHGSWGGYTETMTVTTNIVGFPCVNDDYLKKTHIPGFTFDLPFHGGKLRFYLCLHEDGSVYWHMSRNEMLAQFPQHIVFGDVDKRNVMVPEHLFDEHEHALFAKLPVMLVRF